MTSLLLSVSLLVLLSTLSQPSAEAYAFRFDGPLWNYDMRAAGATRGDDYNNGVSGDSAEAIRPVRRRAASMSGVESLLQNMSGEEMAKLQLMLNGQGGRSRSAMRGSEFLG